MVGYNVQVYAMDSAFLHARTLFEFFLGKTNDNYYGCATEFGVSTLQSDSYTASWKCPLHRHLMHAQTRSNPTGLNSAGVEKDLNEMPVDFANEVLRLWKEFERQLAKSTKAGDQELHNLARDKRKEAIAGARCVVGSIVTKQHAKEKHQNLEPVFVYAE
jgi:hypothetical protein